jgi:uncharacterized protein
LAEPSLARPDSGAPGAPQDYGDARQPHSIQRATAAKFEISKDHAGKYRFHPKGPEGEIIAASQGYETKASAKKGIEAIKTHAPGAAVEDHSD